MLFVLSLACSQPGGSMEPPAQRPTREAPVHEATLALGGPINAMGFDLYRELIAKDPGNIFYSPASIEVALGMAAAGAADQTRSEMEKVLHLPADGAHKALGALSNSWNTAEDAPYELALANRIWVQTGASMTPEFDAVTNDHYQSPAEPIDFKALGDNARHPINAWVAERTNNSIKSVLPEGSLDRDIRSVLVNAISFKADWLEPFLAEFTKDSQFRSLDGGAGTMELMGATREYRYYDGGSYAVAFLPYQGETLDLVVALPKDDDGLSALEEMLSDEALHRWADHAMPQELDLRFPKMEMGWSHELSAPLEALGMTRAFGGDADFSRMSTDAPIQIGAAHHTAFIAIDEKGTEAAAATAVIMVPDSVGPPPIQFHCDHPFFYAIRDRRSGAMLFMGRLVEPPK